MKIYELLVDEEIDNDSGVFALSLVSMPAIEANWVYFSKDGKKEEIRFATVDADKRTIVAPVLIPQKKILRIDPDTGEEYQVYFTEETVEKLAQKYLKDGYQHNATFEHGKNIDGDVTVVESWVSKSATKDKSNLYFNRAFPAGTWFVTMKVNSENLWKDYIKTGIVKAISLEGIFDHKLVKASKVESVLEKDIQTLNDDEAEVVLSKIRAVIKKDKRFKKKERIDLESYSDYPQSVRNAAQKVLDWTAENGWGSCGTPVGKQRANQLAKGEPISVDTIKRMYSYVSRHEVDLETSTSYSDGCGKLMMDAWGGLGAGRWAKAKLKELGLLEEMESQPSIISSYPGEAASGSIAPATFNDLPTNIEVYGIETEYFYMCPGAIALFQHLQTMELDEDTIGMVRSAALVADRVFDIEEDVIEDTKASPKDLGEAITLVKDFKDIMKEIDDRVGMEHDVNFMDGHIQVIKKYL